MFCAMRCSMITPFVFVSLFATCKFFVVEKYGSSITHTAARTFPPQKIRISSNRKTNSYVKNILNVREFHRGKVPHDISLQYGTARPRALVGTEHPQLQWEVRLT